MIGQHCIHLTCLKFLYDYIKVVKCFHLCHFVWIVLQNPHTDHVWKASKGDSLAKVRTKKMIGQHCIHLTCLKLPYYYSKVQNMVEHRRLDETGHFRST
jgi:hypothetical protein